jgi:hypothetical protein
MKVIVSCAFALALLGTLAIEAAAQSSCSGWNATCLARCGKANCPTCVEKMASCRKTGCWTETQRYGGARHCSLKKS